MWGLFERRFKSILERLQRHRLLLEMESSSIHFAEMKKQREDMLHHLTQYESQRQTSMTEEVFRWLSADPINQEEALYHLTDQCLPGTCDWIFREKDIMDWIQADCQSSPSPVIWLKGIPGSGRPFISGAKMLKS